MPRKKNLSLRHVVLIFLLIFGIFWKLCGAQVNSEGTNNRPDGHEGDVGAFYALRSCHQQLHGDSGEFFSPDYMCSNPPLWCNWTIQVDPGKRINLHLEDLTPNDTCNVKQDQIHVDEPEGHRGGHNILQKCWREAKYTSSSSTLYVVLLIAGWPSQPYRGFYGRFQAFGLPVVYNPQEGFRERDGRAEPSVDLSEEDKPSPASSLPMYDYYDDHAEAEADENQRPVSVVPTVSASTQETSRSGRAAPTPSVQSDPNSLPVSPQQQHEGLKHHPESSTRSPTAIRRNVDKASARPDKEEADVVEDDAQRWSEEDKSAVDGENRTEVRHQNLSPSEGPEPERTLPHPNMVEPLSDHRASINIRNHSDVPHLPGDHLFEVAVEVNFSPDLEESWDDVVRSLLLSVKTLISEQLEDLRSPQSMSPKRIKRLNAGVLFILWLQIGQGSGGPQSHRAVHAAMQSLIGLRGNHGNAVITSVSTADINECGTQLVLCDINANCENSFGSYSCRCRPGFKDESRLGSGGTVCVEVKTAGCSSGLSAGSQTDQGHLSPEAKGVYVLFFLLSSLILMILVAGGMFYHRHHRGAFLVRCRSGSSSISPPDPNNNYHHDESYSSPADPDLPPPPPPARGHRDSWSHPAVDLPLLRFSPLLPPDGYMGSQEAEKK